MVLPRAGNVHDVVTGGQDTVAIRVPAHPMAQQLLTAFGGGIAAPSANRYGRLSPDPRRARARGARRGGASACSTAASARSGSSRPSSAFEGESVRLLRPGGVTAGADPRRWSASCSSAPTCDAPRVPGSAPSHYAPTTPHDHRAGRRDRCAGGAALRRRRAASRCSRSACRCSAHKYVTWINAGPAPGAATGTTCTPTCARSTRQAVPADPGAGRARGRALGCDPRPPGDARRPRWPRATTAPARRPCCPEPQHAASVRRARFIDPFQPAEIRRLVRRVRLAAADPRLRARARAVPQAAQGAAAASTCTTR